jgi:hypothetical protein
VRFFLIASTPSTSAIHCVVLPAMFASRMFIALPCTQYAHVGVRCRCVSFKAEDYDDDTTSNPNSIVPASGSIRRKMKTCRDAYKANGMPIFHWTVVVCTKT